MLAFCSLVNVFLPDHLKFDLASRTFQPTTNKAFEAARARERIELFIQKVSNKVSIRLTSRLIVVTVRRCLMSASNVVNVSRLWTSNSFK